ncbi:hypothetical protein CEY11_21335 [Candidimonas nitroreducens]|uniref:Uncharacterized protein n=1 Tax=Candidimonas nitroreducens TaxID=683354 RepID=A0A225M2A9_9BURK|nr:hypothetical protein CEY11_21335 [Candidimonas nitroreducens]
METNYEPLQSLPFDIDELAKQAELNATTLTKISDREMNGKHLRVYTTYVGGTVVGECFTLESLAHVMGIPMSTMNGRYKRGNLVAWKVNLPNAAGRPARGFPLPLLGDVMRVINTPRLRVHVDSDGTRIGESREREHVPLVPVTVAGQRHYTLDSIAYAFGLSRTTVRHKLRAAGLLQCMRELPSSPRGGRPRHGMPENRMGEVKAVLETGASFTSELDRVLQQATGQYPSAQAQMQAAMAIVPHVVEVSYEVELPNTDRPDWIAPPWELPADVLPAGAPRPVTQLPNDPWIGALAAELEAVAATAKVPESMAVAGATVQPEESETPEHRAERAVKLHYEALTRERPTEQDYADTLTQLGFAGVDDAQAADVIARARTHWGETK